MKIKEILFQGVSILKEYNIEDSNMKARIILADLLEKNKEYLIIHSEDEVKDEICRVFLKNIERLKKQEPLQYIINKQEFMGFEFYVDNNVLIPQPDTEILVEEVISLAEKLKNDIKEEIKILDLCTGSGAIAISLSRLVGNSIVSASDISEAALKIAKENAIKNQANIVFFESDLFDKISNKDKFDIIVSNPPYIETDIIKDLSEEVRKEPILALDGGIDGLYFYRKIIKNAKEYLNENGYLAFEIGYNQRVEVEKIFKECGYKNIYSKKDLSKNDRIVVGQV